MRQQITLPSTDATTEAQSETLAASGATRQLKLYAPVCNAMKMLEFMSNLVDAMHCVHELIVHAKAQLSP